MTAVVPETLTCAAVDTELSQLLLRLLELMKRSFASVAGPRELSSPQMHALRTLSVCGPVPMRQLAGQLNCDASNVTGLTDRLEARGLVERRRDDLDRRVKTLALTDGGHQFVQELVADLISVLPVRVLDADDRLALRDLLRKVVEGNTQPALTAE